MPRRTSDRASPRRPGDEFVTYVADMLAPLGPVQVGRLFGGHGFKLDGVHFAMAFRGALYLRVDAELAAELSALGAQPFSYQRHERTVTLDGYFTVPPDRLDEADAVLAWARRAIQAAGAKARRKRPPIPAPAPARAVTKRGAHSD